MTITKNTPSKKLLNSLCMSLERVVGTQIRFLFMAIWARFWVVHSGWRRRCVRWSGFLGLRGLGLSISVGLLSVRVNKSNFISADNLFILCQPTGKSVRQNLRPSNNISTNPNAALSFRLQSSAVVGWNISRRWSIVCFYNSSSCSCLTYTVVIWQHPMNIVFSLRL